MKSKRILIFLLVLATVLLSGCNMLTIDQMYCLPKRSEGYLNLQSAVDSAMAGLEYHAPISGDYQQPVQMADLSGDGIEEYIVFAKGSGEKPLKVLIFSRVDDKYVLTDKLESNGFAFEQVQYIKFAGGKGYDLVIGRQVSEQVVRPLSIYSMIDGKMQQLLTAHYSRFACVDMNADGQKELFVLRPGETAADRGIAELYTIRNGQVERSQQVTLSMPVDNIKRVMVNRLQDGPTAVYVASDVGENAIITDVYSVLDGVFTNVSLSSESGTSVQTLRNYYVFAADIDNDGVLELPDLIALPPQEGETASSQYLIHWYSMNSDGSRVEKQYTYHSFTGGWYLELDEEIATKVSIKALGNSYEFSVIGSGAELTRLMTLYVFTGQEREEQAVAENRFVLHRTESTVYAAHLEVASAAYKMTQETLKEDFRLITQDLINGNV